MEELYDLMLDPQERNNLVTDPNYRDVLKDMKNRLTAWQEKTSDPLLTESKMKLPKTAICCTAESYGLNEQVILPECREALEKLRGVLQNNIK